MSSNWPMVDSKLQHLRLTTAANGKMHILKMESVDPENMLPVPERTID